MTSPRLRSTPPRTPNGVSRLAPHEEPRPLFRWKVTTQVARLHTFSDREYLLPETMRTFAVTAPTEEEAKAKVAASCSPLPVGDVNDYGRATYAYRREFTVDSEVEEII